MALKFKDLAAAIQAENGMSRARFAAATGWVRDGVCKATDEALERYCRLNPTLPAAEAVKQMAEAL